MSSSRVFTDHQYPIPVDDDFSTVPHESILLKLEETPDNWISDQTLRSGSAAYDEAARRELANWGAEVPWIESDMTWDTRANSKNTLNLRYYGSRSDLEPRHSELFLEDTEFEDAEIAMWNIPKHMATRARERKRVMPDQGVQDNGDRTLTQAGVINATRQTNHRFVNSFKNFSSQITGGQLNNNVSMSVPNHNSQIQDESLLTFRPSNGLNKNYSAKGPQVPFLLGKSEQEVQARLAVEGRSVGYGTMSDKMGLVSRKGQTDSATPTPQVSSVQKRAPGPQDVNAIYRQVINGQVMNSGGTNAPLGKRGAQINPVGTQRAGTEGSARVVLNTQAENRSGTAPQYSGGLNTNVQQTSSVVTPGAEGFISKSTAMATPVSVLTKQSETTPHVYVSNARIIAKGLRGGYDPTKLAGKTLNAGSGVALTLSDRQNIVKNVVPAAKNHGKNTRRSDRTLEARAYIDSTGDSRKAVAPSFMKLGNDRRKVQYNQERELNLINSQNKAGVLAQPVSNTEKVSALREQTASMAFEGVQNLRGKKMGSKYLRPTEITDVEFDDFEDGY